MPNPVKTVFRERKDLTSHEVQEFGENSDGDVMERDNHAGSGDPRVFLAVQRTFLAWTRTALALMGFGFVIARVGVLPGDVLISGNGGDGTVASAASSASLWLGVILVTIGVAVQAMALAEYVQFERRYVAGTATTPARSYHAPLLGVALVAIGAGVALYLISSL